MHYNNCLTKTKEMMRVINRLERGINAYVNKKGQANVKSRKLNVVIMLSCDVILLMVIFAYIF